MVVRKTALSARKVVSLDGMRGLAILAVMLHHSVGRLPSSNFPQQVVAWLSYLGWSGVDLFFVLSGFLITGILLDSRQAVNYFSSFYARRALRIFPLYYMFLAGAFLLFPWVIPGDWLPVRGDRWLYFFYLTNWETLWHGPWRHSVMAHLWSLAVEEQFYFSWPLFVWVLRPGMLLSGLVAGEVAVICGRALWVMGHGPSQAVVMATVTRMDGLLLGAVCAILVRRYVFPRRVLGAFRVASAAGIWIFLLGMLFSGNSERFTEVVGFPLLAASFALLVLHAVLTDGQPCAIQNVLCRQPLTNVGKYAYGLYVFHVPLFYFADRFIAGLPVSLRHAPGFGYVMTATLILTSYHLAKFSYNRFEKQFLSWKDRYATIA
jgi:peptidoglycan/LPS O-acetylase OafA/YrhL